ncbi:MAG: alpha-ribazole phosphatase [Armatimonadota bacterium]
MTTLYLIRHGETRWNADGRFQGQQNTSLSDTGRQQAATVADAMTRYHLDAVYTSDLARAAETAVLVAERHGLTPITDRRLREASFGVWEGLTLTEVGVQWPELLQAWRTDPLHVLPPGGETLAQVQQRVTELVQEIVRRYPEGQIAIVAHGGSLRAIVALALGADLSIFGRLRLDNCAISIVSARDDHYILLHLNEICHLHQHPPRATWDEAGDQWRLALQTDGHANGSE